MISITLLLAPHPKERARTGRGFAYTPPKTAAFERTAALLARREYGKLEPLLGPLKLSVRFVLLPPKSTKNIHPCVRPDLDNYIKSLTDSLNGVVWKDDGQLVEINARKLYDVSGGAARIELEIEEVKS